MLFTYKFIYPAALRKTGQIHLILLWVTLSTCAVQKIPHRVTRHPLPGGGGDRRAPGPAQRHSTPWPSQAQQNHCPTLRGLGPPTGHAGGTHLSRVKCTDESLHTHTLYIFSFVSQQKATGQQLLVARKMVAYTPVKPRLL